MRFYKLIFASTIITLLTACTQIAQEIIVDTPMQVNVKNATPKNIIFMIGDGMGTAQVYAALTAKKGNLEMARCKHVGFVKTNSANDYITDSAAGSTAFATGKKTDNGKISVSPELDTLNTILEYAEFNGLATGLVVTSKITHATPAAYVAHNHSRYNYEEIAEDFLKTDVDVLLGGGLNHFVKRADARDLISEFRMKDYQLVYDTTGMQEVNQGKLIGLLWADDPPKWSEGRDDFLEKASLKAIELLSDNEDGFFLMIEGSQIDWGGHDNDSKYVVNESVDFDNVVGKVLNYAENDGETLVVITADHETGGYAINGGSLTSGTVLGKFTSYDHTSTMVPLFAYGPGAGHFTGIIDNTDIYYKMMKLLNLEEKIIE
jgi:alkaline phosphatase